MNNRIVFVVIVTFFVALLGGGYGAIYDQITYSICPEFFINMRFEEYHLSHNSENVRWNVAKIGFNKTYVLAAFLGLILGSS